MFFCEIFRIFDQNNLFRKLFEQFQQRNQKILVFCKTKNTVLFKFDTFKVYYTNLWIFNFLDQIIQNLAEIHQQ